MLNKCNKSVICKKKNVGFSNGLQWVYAPCSLIKNSHDDGIVEASIFASAKSKATQPLDTIKLTKKSKSDIKILISTYLY